ncbi:MAG: GntR family transcriptional regulator [Pseudomonadota bacterium]
MPEEYTQFPFQTALNLARKDYAGCGNVDRVYAAMKAKVTAFQILPGERINESALSKVLDTSRTPLREALNRLASEGLITFELGKGFFCRRLEPGAIIDLYETRVAVECAAARHACQRARESEIADLRSFLAKTGPEAALRSVAELVDLDEKFHLAIAQFSRNAELVRILLSINDRIRFIRWIDMEERRVTTQGEHLAILDAVAAQAADQASAIMRRHIEKRSEEIVAAVKEGYARLYVQEDGLNLDQSIMR